MLALDLFNTRYEQELAEGAVDNLEARRIDILNDRMDDLIHRASVPNNKEAREALMNEYNKVKAERDSYYKVNTSKTTNEMGYGSVVGENDQIPVGRMQPGTPEYAAARNRSVKYAELTPDYTGGHKTAGPTTVGYKKATNKPLVPGEVEVAEAELPGNLPPEQIPGKEDLLKGRGRSYYEAQDQKKNSKVEPDTFGGSDISDPAIDRLLTKAHRERPKAKSDAEALAMKILGKEQDDVDRLDQVNDREDRMIAKLDRLEQDLQHQIDQLKGHTELDEDQQLHVGDPVEIIGDVQFSGATGEIIDFGQRSNFIIINLYNHGTHSFNSANVEYNQYADDEDEVDEGFQDFNKVEPYAVCLAGKPVKKFDYYEEARKFHDNWKQKLYREGDKVKADKITLMPLNLDEVYTPSPAKPFRNPPGFNKQGTGVGNKLAQQTRAELNQWRMGMSMAGEKEPTQSKGTPVPAKAFAQGVLKDLKKVNVKDQGVAEGSEHNVGDTVNYSTKVPGFSKSAQGGQGKITKKTATHYTVNGKEMPHSHIKSRAHGVAEDATPQIDDTWFKQGSFQTYKKASPIKYTVPGKPGTVQTLEGPVKHSAQARIITGPKGEQYPVEPEKFAQLYDDNGDGTATPKKIPKMAKLADHDGVLHTSWGDLQYTAGNDYIVRHGTGDYGAVKKDIFAQTYAMPEQGVAEAQTDYQKRRQRERDVDAGKPVSRQAKNPQTDYARKRAKEKRDLEQFGEGKANYNFDVEDLKRLERIRDLPTLKTQAFALISKPSAKPMKPEKVEWFKNALERMNSPMKVIKLMYDLLLSGEGHAVVGSKSSMNPNSYRQRFNEESSTSSEAVERAVLNRIMVAHTDLLMQFGPEKVMQAAEEVAYGVGDVDEIGTSDVSAYVNQVRQILGA